MAALVPAIDDLNTADGDEGVDVRGQARA